MSSAGPVTKPLARLLVLLGRFWLQEIQPSDLPVLQALPDLGAHLPPGGGGLLELAVEYQRLFGFNLPPYESVYVDPSALLGAPAAALVQELYTLALWQPPAGARAAAADHLGLQLTALGERAVSANPAAAQAAGRLWREHSALWAPVFVLALRRLQPHPFYAALGEVTLEALLAPLPPAAESFEPFPDLPPAPRYRANLPEAEPGQPDLPDPAPEIHELEGPGLNALVRGLLAPREAGLYLTRQDLVLIGKELQLPPGGGERFRMLRSLFELAGQYQQVEALLSALQERLVQAQAEYRLLVSRFPAWAPYALAWQKRLEATRRLLAETG